MAIVGVAGRTAMREMREMREEKGPMGRDPYGMMRASADFPSPSSSTNLQPQIILE